MFCINCFYKKTNVTNSRPHKKSPSVWRRRRCSECGAIFTTTERPSLADNTSVSLPDGSSDTFSLSRLTISIAASFTHSPEKAKYDSLWLAQTAEDILSTEHTIITPDEITATVHQVLKRFDELAAIQYAARHKLLTATRRRGRPSLSPAEPEPPTDASPSP